MSSVDLFLMLRRHLAIVHHVPGRIRVRIARSILKDLAHFEPDQVKGVLLGARGVREVRVNAQAGSVVIDYATQDIQPQWWADLLAGPEGQARARLGHLLEPQPSETHDPARVAP
ncbi:MAG: hypothetical protein ACOC00_07175 [Halothiobacillaceae bacterium]